MKMAHPAQIKAAEVYDQDRDLTEAEQTFLLAVDRIGKTFCETLDNANKQWGPGSRAWKATKTLAERSRDAAYQIALDAFNASYDKEVEAVELAMGESAEEQIERRCDFIMRELNELCAMAVNSETVDLIEKEKITIGQ
jgi:hypothetical protein